MSRTAYFFDYSFRSAHVFMLLVFTINCKAQGPFKAENQDYIFSLLDSASSYVGINEAKIHPFLEEAALIIVADSPNIAMHLLPHAQLYTASNANDYLFSVDYWLTTARFYRTQANHPEAVMFAFYRAAEKYNIDFKMDSALIYNDSCLYYARLHNNLTIQNLGLTQRSLTYKDKLDLTAAKTCLFEAIKLAKEGNAPAFSIIRHNLEVGHLFAVPQEIDSALLYYNKALTIAREEKDYRNIANGLEAISRVFVRIEQYDSAIHYIELAKPSIHKLDTFNMSLNYLDFAMIYLAAEDYKNYQTNVDSCLYFAKQIGRSEVFLKVKGVQAEYEAIRGNWNEATTLYNSFFKEVKEDGNLDGYLKRAKRLFILLQKENKKTVPKATTELMTTVLQYLDSAATKIMYKDKKALAEAKALLSHLEGNDEQAFLLMRSEYSDLVENYNNELVTKKIQLEGLQKLNKRETQLVQEKLLSEKLKVETKLKSSVILSVAIVSFLLLIILLFTRNSYKQRREKLELKQKVNEQQLALAERQIGGLNKELTQNQKELTTFALEVINKNNLLRQLDHSLKTAKTKEDFTRIKQTLKLGLKEKKDWAEFKQRFENVDPEFIVQLNTKFPDLTAGQIRLASLIKLGFSSKQIADFLNHSPASVNVARSKLRKKLQIQSEMDIYDYLVFI